MPISARQQFNSAAKLSESMLRLLKSCDGLQGPMKAQLFDGPEPVGALCANLPALHVQEELRCLSCALPRGPALSRQI